MLAACEEQGVDVRGEFPVYEMFPYRVKLDTENQDIYLDRKKVQCLFLNIRGGNIVFTIKSIYEIMDVFNCLFFRSVL